MAEGDDCSVLWSNQKLYKAVLVVSGKLSSLYLQFYQHSLLTDVWSKQVISTFIGSKYICENKQDELDEESTEECEMTEEIECKHNKRRGNGKMKNQPSKKTKKVWSVHVMCMIIRAKMNILNVNESSLFTNESWSNMNSNFH